MSYLLEGFGFSHLGIDGSEYVSKVASGYTEVNRVTHGYDTLLDQIQVGGRMVDHLWHQATPVDGIGSTGKNGIHEYFITGETHRNVKKNCMYWEYTKTNKMSSLCKEKKYSRMEP